MNYLKNERGMAFLLEIVLIALVLGVAGVAVYGALQAKNKAAVQSPAATPSPVAAADPTSGWQTYTDDYFSLKYPKDWTVTKDDYLQVDGSYFLKIAAPVDASLVAADPTQKNLYLGGLVGVAKRPHTADDCIGCGKVNAVEKITSNGVAGSLIVAESGMPGESAVINFIKADAKVGAATFDPMGFAVGDGYYFEAEADYRIKGTPTSLIGFKDAASIKNSKQYGQFKEVLKSLKVKTGRLTK